MSSSPSNSNADPLQEELATLGGGCFWCLEAAFRRLRGVSQVLSGYAGGHDPRPDYRRVCAGTTGHAEVVQVRFDPAQISYRQLLEVFFALHDPTTLNRQGNDVGTQYRSVIFWHSAAQQQAAETLIQELESERVWSAPIVTQRLPAPVFHVAEDYHQTYFDQNGGQAYCQYVVAPKVEKLRKVFRALLAEAD